MDENFNERPAFDVECPRECGKMTEVERHREFRRFECPTCHWIVKVTTRQKMLKENFVIACMYVGVVGFGVGLIVAGYLMKIAPIISKAF